MSLVTSVSAPFRKHPITSTIQILTVLISLPAFFMTVSFMAAVTPEQAAARSLPPLPIGWTAGVMNHGRYYQWWPISERPVLFGVSVAVLVGAMFVLTASVLWIWKRDRKSAARGG